MTQKGAKGEPKTADSIPSLKGRVMEATLGLCPQQRTFITCMEGCSSQDHVALHATLNVNHCPRSGSCRVKSHLHYLRVPHSPTRSKHGEKVAVSPAHPCSTRRQQDRQTDTGWTDKTRESSAHFLSPSSYRMISLYHHASH